MMSVAAELAPGTLLAGFRIESLVGRGGMGVVYRATQLSLERQVALKLISPELASEERFRERFLREARLAASLEHPHLLPVYEAGEEEGTLFLAMRLVSGSSLAEILRREGRLAPERALTLFSQLCQALAAAHEAGLLHRDVKPENVLVTGEGEREHAYLCDFGLSRRLQGGSLTRERAFLGTAAYAAPEQIRGEQLDERCDLYALACAFYECLTGEPPFPREDELALLWAHLHEPAPLPSSLDPTLAGFDPFFTRALAKDPGDRYPSASELAQAAQTALAGALPAGPPAAGQALKLPRPVTSFLGRERELQEVLELLLHEDVRLLTLTGPGGTGKTRLALRAATHAADAFRDGVHWVGFAALRDPALVTETIAQTLGAKDGLAEHISERELLLLLDNLEQVIAAAPELASLLSSCPNLTLLVTSRELLRVQGEVEYPVPPLAVPEAVALFCERSGLDPSADIAELCARLDNLPLAVELAAARATLFSPQQILDRLAKRLDLLKGGRDADPRQQTLRTTISWSYELLTPEEQRLFARLSVFAGSCTYEAAEEVAGADPDTLQSLLEKNLLRRRDTDLGPRFWMLETIREFAEERLAQLGDAESTRRGHAEWFLALAEAHEPTPMGAPDKGSISLLLSELDNLRAAIELFSTLPDPRDELRLVGTLFRFWEAGGLVVEGRQVADCALARSNQDGDPRLRGKVLYAASLCALHQGDLEVARRYDEERLGIARIIDDKAQVAVALNDLGVTAIVSGDLESATAFYEESRALAAGIGETETVVSATNNLSDVAIARHDYASARALAEEAIALISPGDPWRVNPESNLAFALLGLGEVELAGERFRDTIELVRSTLGPAFAVMTLDGLAAVAAARSEFVRAARLTGSAQEIRYRGSFMEDTSTRDWAERTKRAGREALGDERWELECAKGAKMTLDEAVAYAREDPTHSEPRH